MTPEEIEAARKHTEELKKQMDADVDQAKSEGLATGSGPAPADPVFTDGLWRANADDQSEDDKYFSFMTDGRMSQYGYTPPRRHNIVTRFLHRAWWRTRRRQINSWSPEKFDRKLAKRSERFVIKHGHEPFVSDASWEPDETHQPG